MGGRRQPKKRKKPTPKSTPKPTPTPSPSTPYRDRTEDVELLRDKALKSFDGLEYAIKAEELLLKWERFKAQHPGILAKTRKLDAEARLMEAKAKHATPLAEAELKRIQAQAETAEVMAKQAARYSGDDRPPNLYENEFCPESEKPS